MELLKTGQYKRGGEPKLVELEMDEAKRSDQKLVRKEVNEDRADRTSYREL
ncbi:hypothetical protein [Alkalicoccus urumqiensis]|uniref:hypothetical protein n=1 Tax=Alkalicoccus urumqiensis TaxID=1548213 RepID=UPI0015E5E098|nr:hypothetical protein [Alkalicoccus urumqiensis]